MSVEYIPGMPGYEPVPDFSANRRKGAIELSNTKKGRKALNAFSGHTDYELSSDEQAHSLRYSGFTPRGGRLVHVFIDFAQNNPDEKYYVVTGNMESGEVSERGIYGVEHNDPHQSPALEIYLDGRHRGEEHILLTNSYFEYDPGTSRRVERLQPIERLLRPALGRLAVVRGR